MGGLGEGGSMYSKIDLPHYPKYDYSVIILLQGC